ncbi:glycosyltransferase family 2 protein [Candidatus Gottesmanbacteria bacterium]|nr:glycosyltransferase family 2 protein [Candidatus Gottesmanbacteria bacterium]
MDLSIIIPNFNTKNLLTKCLTSIETSLSAALIRYEIIVIDNGSKDGSIALIKRSFPHVVLIQNKTNVGYGKSNNVGIKRAKGECVLLLNSDIEVLDSAIKTLYSSIQTSKDIFLGGRLLNPDYSPQSSCGPMYTLPVVFTMLFLKGDVLGITRGSPSRISKVDWISGACLMGRKTDFIQIGLFDEKIFMYMDEIDFLYRAKQKGYTIVYNPDARFIHVGAASSGTKKTPILNIYTGLLYFYSKHRSQSELSVLKVLLRIKARMVIVICNLIGRKEIVSIYEKALALV